MGSHILGVENYVKRSGDLIYFRPTQFVTSVTAEQYTNGMDAGEARAVASELIRLAGKAEKPHYKPGEIYRSAWNNRYVYIGDNKFVALAGGGAWNAGETVFASQLSHPLTEEGN